MPLDPAIVTALALRCAPTVAPQTLLAVARAESGFDPLAIGVNGHPGYSLSPPTAVEAERQAGELIAAGANVDLGLLQINARTLQHLKLSLADAFDPCRNLSAAAQVLQTDYRLGLASGAIGQQALHIALSYYNTGRSDRGFTNGYVARVTGMARPAALRPIADEQPRPGPHWSVFGQAAATFVITPTAQGDAP